MTRYKVDILLSTYTYWGGWEKAKGEANVEESVEGSICGGQKDDLSISSSLTFGGWSAESFLCLLVSLSQDLCYIILLPPPPHLQHVANIIT
jgi:hypothetical protein